MKFENFVEQFIRINREANIRSKLHSMMRRILDKFLKDGEIDFSILDDTTKDIVDSFMGKEDGDKNIEIIQEAGEYKNEVERSYRVE